MPQQQAGWQEEEAAVREAEGVRFLASRSASKPHLDSQTSLSITKCLASLQNHSGWESNILNLGGAVYIPVP